VVLESLVQVEILSCDEMFNDNPQIWYQALEQGSVNVHYVENNLNPLSWNIEKRDNMISAQEEYSLTLTKTYNSPDPSPRHLPIT
jgi:hypothetical protein